MVCSTAVSCNCSTPAPTSWDADDIFCRGSTHASPLPLASVTLVNSAVPDATTSQLVDQSTAQCCHCGYRNSHASNFFLIVLSGCPIVSCHCFPLCYTAPAQSSRFCSLSIATRLSSFTMHCTNRSASSTYPTANTRTGAPIRCRRAANPEARTLPRGLPVSDIRLRYGSKFHSTLTHSALESEEVPWTPPRSTDLPWYCSIAWDALGTTDLFELAHADMDASTDERAEDPVPTPRVRTSCKMETPPIPAAANPSARFGMTNKEIQDYQYGCIPQREHAMAKGERR
ncbi:uncharacterized protein FOMMEDRAFT_161457 [Fomitiporia mediterranea MF3/22]|uniref:uncharacterized protein n=1 Tax=Fomitiporia mediterranea (strain MF3/22) TaxID=694068 RepID=UPI0004408FC6|nr:uncharacterized protein FOMMEDRAFT_161457 [Fomitiporia mediterranea MF3/22]EJC98631.1 hypothetical protein FOMMEDRAFT_161457 [Fomitiporia mediterranea MF3/22]